jgi:hypothetical protein
MSLHTSCDVSVTLHKNITLRTSCDILFASIQGLVLIMYPSRSLLLLLLLLRYLRFLANRAIGPFGLEGEVLKQHSSYSAACDIVFWAVLFGGASFSQKWDLGSSIGTQCESFQKHMLPY